MSNLLFLLTAMNAAGCPQPKIVNWSDVWTSQDGQTYASSLDRCKVHFGEEFPCLKTFIKKKERTYYVICSIKPHKNTSNTPADRWFYFTTIPKSPEKQQGTSSGSQVGQDRRCNGTCPNRPSIAGGGN